MDLIWIYVALLVNWSLVCFSAGLIWDAKQRIKADMDAREQWATETETRYNKGEVDAKL